MKRENVTIKMTIVMKDMPIKHIEKPSKRAVTFSEVLDYKQKMFDEWGQSLKMFTAFDENKKEMFYQFRHKDFTHN